MNNSNNIGVIIPLIRQVMPQVIAETLVNVQPMLYTKTDVGEGWYENNQVYFYWVKPVSSEWLNWDETVERNHEIIAWCIETFGPPAKDYGEYTTARYAMNSGKFYFRDETDRTAFLLKWT